VRPALLDISIQATDQKDHRFKDFFQPYPSLKQLDIRLKYYGDWIPYDYFDFTAYPEDAGLTLHMKVSDTEIYIEAPVSVVHAIRVFASDQSSP
jgi:hypothetical protein